MSGYKAMSELRRNGNVKAIGLGVNENEVCSNALKIGDWDVFLLAGRYTVLEQTPLKTLFSECEKAKTSIICGGPFNSGILVGREMWNYAKAPKDLVEKVQNLRRVSDKYNFPLPAAALQFPLFNSLVSAVIPGARTKEEFAQILNWFFTKIPLDFWNELKENGLMDPMAPTS